MLSKEFAAFIFLSFVLISISTFAIERTLMPRAYRESSSMELVYVRRNVQPIEVVRISEDSWIAIWNVGKEDIEGLYGKDPWLLGYIYRVYNRNEFVAANLCNRTAHRGFSAPSWAAYWLAGDHFDDLRIKELLKRD